LYENIKTTTMSTENLKLPKIVPVILSGGSGTRLWPLSRKQYPKQYLPLVGDNIMLPVSLAAISVTSRGD
jgi:mannose-1-phosphate guanylyltransferase